MILAYIVNESESGILAESNVGVSTLVKLLQKAVDASDHRAQMNPDSNFVCNASELSDCLNHLAINDENKRAISKQNGIATIVHMLQTDFTDDEQCVAAEMLWNLAFVQSIRQSEQLQAALQGKKY